MLPALLLAALLTPRPAPGPVPVVPGVSRALAEARKARISRVGYELDVTVPAQQDSAIVGREIVSFRLRDAREPVQLDFKAPAGYLYSLNLNGQPVPIEHRAEHLLLPAKVLRVGDNVVRLQLRLGEQSLNRNADYLYTLLVPDRTRTVFPCFDQPDLKASFTLTLTVPRAWQVLANAKPAGHIERDLTKTMQFRPSDTLSTYLFSFVAGKFTHTFEPVRGRTMALLHRETDSAKIRLSTPVIFETHGRALAFMEEYTGLKFPFQKLDFAAIPDFQYGGMEHVGAIDYKASSLFLDQGATKDQLVARQNLIGHETAHMWFGDLVTMRWFNDVWMKEVFANFMADKLSAGTEDAEGQLLKFLTDHYPAAYAVDRTLGANPIRQPLNNLQDAGSLYGNIIYHKAPIMMHQLETLMGEENFRAGVREYLAKYAGGNASWPDLITILDAHTPADLAAWNQVWVNEPGRPVVDYSLKTAGGKVTELTVAQFSENGSKPLPQRYSAVLLSATGQVLARGTVHDEGSATPLPWAVGVPAPAYVVLNADGLGYGLFSVSAGLAQQLPAFTAEGWLRGQPSQRAALYISLYENMLRGADNTPRQLLAAYATQLPHEDAELNIKLLTNQLSAIYWQFLTPAERAAQAPAVEAALWQALQAAATPGAQKLFFQAYQRVALTPAALGRLYEVWHTQQAPAQVKLTEDDYTSLALALAVHDYPAPQPILPQQLARVKNPDRRARLEYLMPALSPDVAVRDKFFAGLAQEKNREKEAWVTSALGYLHHPLRQATSEKYLPQSLALLQEIQLTGDIFFPAAWLQATLGPYQSPAAAQVVRDFLATHKTYNPQLRGKILQAADDLFRAEKLVK
ncbi:M1 family aminopeptidase [Hymenobacter polaris]|nr:M1 family aminopeptidase [Hymenobacter polaris]